MLFKKKKKNLARTRQMACCQDCWILQIHKRIHCTSIERQMKIKLCYYFYDLQRKIYMERYSDNTYKWRKVDSHTMQSNFSMKKIISYWSPFFILISKSSSIGWRHIGHLFDWSLNAFAHSLHIHWKIPDI